MNNGIDIPLTAWYNMVVNKEEKTMKVKVLNSRTGSFTIADLPLSEDEIETIQEDFGDDEVLRVYPVEEGDIDDWFSSKESDYSDIMNDACNILVSLEAVNEFVEAMMRMTRRYGDDIMFAAYEEYDDDLINDLYDGNGDWNYEFEFYEGYDCEDLGKEYAELNDLPDWAYYYFDFSEYGEDVAIDCDFRKTSYGMLRVD